MADFTINAPTFPNAASVKAYAVSGWPGGFVRTDAAPVGSIINTQTMTSDTLTFTGLTEGAEYVAYAEVGGAHRYVHFIADTAPAGAVAIADVTGLEDALDDKQDAATAATDAELSVITANLQTDSYTLVLTDAGKCVEINKATAVDLTVPPNASVAFPVDTVIEIHQVGAGLLTVVEGAAVTVTPRTGLTRELAGQGATAALRKRATNVWALSGDVAAS